MPETYTGAEVRALSAAAEDHLVCPRCGSPLDRRPIPPRPDVSYVRTRLWVVCPGCHRSAVVDRRTEP